MFGMGKGKKGGFKMAFRRRKTAQADASGINKFPTSPIKMSHMFGKEKDKDPAKHPERPERTPARSPKPEAASPRPEKPEKHQHHVHQHHAASPKPRPKTVELKPVEKATAEPEKEKVVEPTADASVNPDAPTLNGKNKLLLRNELKRQARAAALAKAAKEREERAKANHDIISVPEPKEDDKEKVNEREEPEHDATADADAEAEADPEADVATVKKGVRGHRTTPSEFDVPAVAVEPVQPLKLDGARAAKIPHFMSEWFNPNPNPNQQKHGGENRDPNQPRAPRAAAAKPAPLEAVENVVSFPTNKDSRTPGLAANSQNIKYSEIRLGRMIGEGAFGKVYEGKWRGRGVAVKVLVCQDLRSDILHEFQSEVEIMSVLRHPNICRLLGACLDPPNRALVIELMQRGSLWGLLRTHRKSLDLDMRTRFIYDTAKGMAYLHHFERPILHRDLKSPNLLVDKNYNIKLSDFGLARVKAHVQTMTGNCGTVQWMAPEVLGNQKYTEKADVFSFGIVIWEVMTGECPYDGMSQIQAALGVLNRNLRPTIPKQCPPFFSRLMKACWNRQPELRPSFPHIVSAFRTYQSSLSETRATSSAAASAKAAVAAASVAAA